MTEYVVAGYGYEGKAGKRHRVFAKYRDGFLPLVWFSVGKDGSLYVGPYVPDADGAKSGVVRSDDFGTVSVCYEDGVEFRTAGAQATKVSFHASGVMHYDNKRGFTPKLGSRDYREPICIILPAKPKERHIKSAAEIRSTDIVTEHTIKDDAPSHVAIFFHSVGDTHEFRELAKTEWKTIVRYANLDRLTATTLEIALIENAEGTWPPYAFVVARAEPDVSDQSDTPGKP